MKNNIIVKYCVMVLLLAGWIACGSDTKDSIDEPEIPDVVGENPNVPEEPEEPPSNPDSEDEEGVIKIENLQTRLRIFEMKSNDAWMLEYVPFADPRKLIIHYTHSSETAFGYVDESGQVCFCKVSNFPETALQWKGEFVNTTVWGTTTEINVLMNGRIRLDSDETGKKYGTMELTSLEPSGPGIKVPVKFQLGMYTEIYPVQGRTKIHFDKDSMQIVHFYYQGETLKLESFDKILYEIQEDYTIQMTHSGETFSGYFRVMNDSIFEIYDMHKLTAHPPAAPLMTLKKDNNQ